MRIAVVADVHGNRQSKCATEGFEPKRTTHRYSVIVQVREWLHCCPIP